MNALKCIFFPGQLPGTPSEHFVDRVTQFTEWFDEFKEEEQTWFVRMLLSRMHHHQHGSINSYLKPILQRHEINIFLRLSQKNNGNSVSIQNNSKKLRKN